MCGFSGFLSGAWPGDAAPSRLKAMTDAIAHRGPDSEGQWLDAYAAIALRHRRLAIVELSAAGEQPMLLASVRYVLAFNGEIYTARCGKSMYPASAAGIITCGMC